MSQTRIANQAADGIVAAEHELKRRITFQHAARITLDAALAVIDDPRLSLEQYRLAGVARQRAEARLRIARREARRYWDRDLDGDPEGNDDC